MRPEVADALLGAAYEWTMSRRTLLKSTSSTTEDALALMAGGPAEDKKRGVKRAHAEWVSGTRRTAPAVRSRCRAFLIQSGMARGHED